MERLGRGNPQRDRDAVTITLNGKKCDDFDAPLTVSELLERLGLGGQPVLVELDAVALRPREFADATVADGAQVEIIRVAAGG